MHLIPGAAVSRVGAQRNTLDSDVSALPYHASVLFAWPSTRTNPASEAFASRLTRDLQTVATSSCPDTPQVSSLVFQQHTCTGSQQTVPMQFLIEQCHLAIWKLVEPLGCGGHRIEWMIQEHHPSSPKTLLCLFCLVPQSGPCMQCPVTFTTADKCTKSLSVEVHITLTNLQTSDHQGIQELWLWPSLHVLWTGSYKAFNQPTKVHFHSTRLGMTICFILQWSTMALVHIAMHAHLPIKMSCSNTDRMTGLESLSSHSRGVRSCVVWLRNTCFISTSMSSGVGGS